MSAQTLSPTVKLAVLRLPLACWQKPLEARGSARQPASQLSGPARLTPWLCAAATLFAQGPALALTFKVTFDANSATPPAAFAASFASVLQLYESHYTDPITINLNVGWGEINGIPVAPNALGQSLTNEQAVRYATLKSALTSDAKSVPDAIAVSSLPAVDPTPGINFAMSNAQAKALGLLAANATGVDGWVGFNSRAEYFFDQALGGTGAQFDFFAIASHEVSEVMGRYGFGQNGGGDSLIDLFRYLTGDGQRDLAPTRGIANYFSIDGGLTRINSFNVAASGDLSDWAGDTLDAYNASPAVRTVLPTSAADLILMDVLGYDSTAAVPEVPPGVLLAEGIAAMLGLLKLRARSIKH